MGLDTALNLIVPLKNKIVVEGWNGTPTEINTIRLTILYFRKCYDIADRIGDMLEGNAESVGEAAWEFPLDTDYLDTIRDIIRSEYENVLDGQGFHSVWEKQDYLNILGRNIVYTDMLTAFALEKFDFDELVDGCHEINEREQKTFFKAFDDANIDVEKIKCEFYNSY